MIVHVKLFAALASHWPEVAAGAPFAVELPEAATLTDLVRQLELPAERLGAVFVNGRPRPLEWALHAGDEVGFFPLIGGG